MPFEETSNSFLTFDDKGVSEANVLGESNPYLPAEAQEIIFTFSTENDFDKREIGEDEEIGCASLTSLDVFINQEGGISDDTTLLLTENNINCNANGTNAECKGILLESDLDLSGNPRERNCEIDEALNFVDLNEECSSLDNNFNFNSDIVEESLNVNGINLNAIAYQENSVIASSECGGILRFPINTFDRNSKQRNYLSSTGKHVSSEHESKTTTTENKSANAVTLLVDKIFASQGFISSVSSNPSMTETPLGEKCGNKKYVCEICSEEFKRKVELVQHSRVHTGERSFDCHLCEKRFMDKKVLSRHVRTHTGEKKHACEICGKAFIEKRNLIEHILIHTGERPFACEICQKRFKTKRDLKVHRVIHEQPYVCEVCKKEFCTKDALAKHRRVHSASPEKIYVCGVCQKAFKNTSRLNEHLIVHTGVKPHVCSMCPCSFTRKSSLNRHLLLHTGEKTFACELCHKKFSLKYKLAEHMRTHSDDKPFVCEVCNSTFRSISSLNSHFAAIHAEEKSHICSICKVSFNRKSSLNRHQLQHYDTVVEDGIAPENIEM